MRIVKQFSDNLELKVFLPSAGLIFLFLGLAIWKPEPTERHLTWLNHALSEYLGWLLILAVSGFLFFTFYLLFSRYGRIRLGPDDSKPDFHFLTWLSMLFSAGMGIGLLFYGVAEPLIHFANPPYGTPESLEAARNSMSLTYFHWGLHAWSTYIIVGLSMAYFGFRKGMPLSLRSAFYPLLGQRIHGWFGHSIDILAIFGTLFGVATSLGLGAMQVNAGLTRLFDIEKSTEFAVWLIFFITLAATASVWTGLNKGIRRLSELNMGMASLLLLFVFVCGPSLFILNALVQNVGFFLQNFFRTMFWTEAFTESGWQSNWTVFYWAWWISWAPFVGLFIARISRGRTLGEFVAGVLFVPSVMTYIWMTVFGGSAVYMAFQGDQSLVLSTQENMAFALFDFFARLPLSSFMSGLSLIVILSFFVTSSDSGSFVIDMIASGGKPNPPRFHRVFWALAEGAVAGVLLLSGGLVALQTAALATAIPFTVVLIAMCASLLKALRAEPINR